MSGVTDHDDQWSDIWEPYFGSYTSLEVSSN